MAIVFRSDINIGENTIEYCNDTNIPKFRLNNQEFYFICDAEYSEVEKIFNANSIQIKGFSPNNLKLCAKYCQCKKIQGANNPLNVKRPFVTIEEVNDIILQTSILSSTSIKTILSTINSKLTSFEQ